jgi:hypothetical protein
MVKPKGKAGHKQDSVWEFFNRIPLKSPGHYSGKCSNIFKIGFKKCTKYFFFLFFIGLGFSEDNILVSLFLLSEI